jgi:hypothetical protein
MATQPQEPKDWHLDRRLQITHILSTLSLGVGAVLYVGDIRKDVEILKVQTTAQAGRDASQDKTADQVRAETQSRFDRIDAKLDRLIDYTRSNGKGAR